MMLAQDSGKYSYEGVAVCGMCHRSAKQGNQLKIWQESAHAKAFEVLKSPEAAKIAKEKGLSTTADKADACLKCHASGYNVDAARLGKRFKVEDGVQCETCHGPGSAYKSMKIMKDAKLAEENGLILHTDVEKFCKSCHNEESPTYKSFNFAESWGKVKHPVPGK
jgi:hypothetical protein